MNWRQVKMNPIRTRESVRNGHSKRGRGAIAQRGAAGNTVIALFVVVAALVVFLVFSLMPPQSGTPTSSTTSSESTSSAGSTTATSSTYVLAYLSTDGGCSAGGMAAPCWGSPAYVFDCLSAAQTQQGCTELVVTTSPNWNYTINIRYPFSNQTEPSWANCLWTLQGQVPGQGYGHCNQVNSTSFTIGEPAPPPQ